MVLPPPVETKSRGGDITETAVVTPVPGRTEGTFSTRWFVSDTTSIRGLEKRFYRAQKVSKPVSKSKYHCLTYSMSFDTVLRRDLPTERGFSSFFLTPSEKAPLR